MQKERNAKEGQEDDASSTRWDVIILSLDRRVVGIAACLKE